MNSTRRRSWTIIAIFCVALLGLFLTFPIGSTTTDCFPMTVSPDCGTFDQSVLIKTAYPYPHWIPVAGALVGAAVGLLVVMALQRWGRTRASSG